VPCCEPLGELLGSACEVPWLLLVVASEPFHEAVRPTSRAAVPPPLLPKSSVRDVRVLAEPSAEAYAATSASA